MIPQFDLVFLMTDDHAVASKQKDRFNTITTERELHNHSQLRTNAKKHLHNKIVARNIRSLNQGEFVNDIMKEEESPYSEKLKKITSIVTPDRELPEHLIKHSLEYFKKKYHPK